MQVFYQICFRPPKKAEGQGALITCEVDVGRGRGLCSNIYVLNLKVRSLPVK